MTRQKNKREDSKVELNDSPEIQDGEGGGHQTSPASLRGGGGEGTIRHTCNILLAITYTFQTVLSHTRTDSPRAVGFTNCHSFWYVQEEE